MHISKISDGNTMTVDLLDYGARIVGLHIGGTNVVCRYTTPDAYTNDPFYLGATIGPITNRVHNGQLNIQGQTFQMPRNDGNNSLHSGGNGFDKQTWHRLSQSDNRIRYQLDYDLIQVGMVGLLSTIVSYTAVDNTLIIEYQSHCNQPTYLNLTNHAYFNLSGHNSRIDDHDFELLADSFVDVDQHNIPLGSISNLSQPMHYNIAKKATHAELNGGCDHHFNVGDPTDKLIRPMLKAISDTTGIALTVNSDAPGFQFYTGQYLSSPFAPSAGFCVETQLAPDAINQAAFYAPLLCAGEYWRQRTELQFTAPS